MVAGERVDELRITAKMGASDLDDLSITTGLGNVAGTVESLGIPCPHGGEHEPGDRLTGRLPWPLGWDHHASWVMTAASKRPLTLC